MRLPHRLNGDIVLTLLAPPDAEAFYSLVDQNREHLGRWFKWVDRYRSVADATAFAEGNLQRVADLSGMTCLVWYRKELSGLVELLNVDRAKRQGEIGFWLGKTFQRRGIARRAADAMIDHAFTCLDFALVLTKANSENRRSLALLSALGFVVGDRDDPVVGMLSKDRWLLRSIGQDRPPYHTSQRSRDDAE